MFNLHTSCVVTGRSGKSLTKNLLVYVYIYIFVTWPGGAHEEADNEDGAIVCRCLLVVLSGDVFGAVTHEDKAVKTNLI